MARRSFRGTRLNQSNRRKTEWSTFDAGGFTSVASGGATLLSGLAFEDPGTIVRTRGVITIKPTSVGSSLTAIGAFGVGLVSAEAFAAGVASIPEPFTDSDWGGWMVIQSFAFRWEVATAVGEQFASVMIDIDSKAMRKVEPNSVMAFVAESNVGAFDIADGTRNLIMLF